MTTGKNTYKKSDGRAIHVDLVAAVEKGQVVYIDGWLGIAADSGSSGETIAMTIDGAEYQFTVPTSLSVSAGDVVYIDPDQVTGYVPDEAGYTTTSSSGLLPLFRATSDKDTDNIVTGILLSRAV